MKQLFQIAGLRTALLGMVAVCWLVLSVRAQVSPPTPSSALAIQRTADSLQRLTQPGYYSALFAARQQAARLAATTCNTYLCQSPPVNTAPVATTNNDQSVLSGNPFSYTVDAFTDAETPNSLTYIAGISPVNGLTFNSGTRVISGTPTAVGSISVTITATDPGGLSATTSFFINVSRRLGSGGPGLTVTLTATPATLLTTGTTSLSATASGGTSGSAYSYTFSGPGTITASSNTATVSGLPTGIQTFTVVAGDGNRTVTGTVSVTVSAPAQQTTLSVLSRDPDNGQLNTNTLKPYLQLQNDGNTAIPYSEITVRYWLTVENYSPLRYDINYAQLGSDKVHLQYVPAPNTGNPGATGYIEFSFDASAGSLAPISNSGPIQDLINKQDYSAFNQADDYSYVNTGNFAPNARITAYRRGPDGIPVLVWGREPGPVVATQSVKAMLQNNTGADANTIEAVLSVTNDGNVPVNYGDLKVRYYFTADGNQPLVLSQVGYTALGSGNVTARLVTISPALAGADTYLELSFSAGLGQLAPGASTGGVTYQLRHADYSGFNQTNDYSYQGTGGMMLSSQVVVFVAGQRVWGNEPRAGGRLSAELVEVPLQVRVLGNPVAGSVIEVQVRGAEGQPLRLQLTDVQGRAVSERQIDQASAVDRQTLSLGQQPAGLLLLRVSTPTQSQTVKVLKTD